MARKKDDARPRDKILSLYQRLVFSGQKLYQADLAEELNCSSQTVARLVEQIGEHLESTVSLETGKDGRRRYYRVSSRKKEPALGFHFEELHYLAICRDLASPFLPDAVKERVDQSICSLALTLGERRVDRNGIGHTPVRFRSKGYIDYRPYWERLSTLYSAITKRQVCRILYRSGSDVGATPKEYRYAPGRVLAAGGTLYLDGFKVADGLLLADRPTTFSVHRIVQVDLTGEYFCFDASGPEARAFGLTWHAPRSFSIRIKAEAADYVRDRIWSDDQVLEDQEDGGVILTVTATGEKELQAWVWSFGGLAEFINIQ